MRRDWVSFFIGTAVGVATVFVVLAVMFYHWVAKSGFD